MEAASVDRIVDPLADLGKHNLPPTARYRSITEFTPKSATSICRVEFPLAQGILSRDVSCPRGNSDWTSGEVQSAASNADLLDGHNRLKLTPPLTQLGLPIQVLTSR